MRTTEAPTAATTEVPIEHVWRALKDLPWLEQPCPLNNSDTACDMFDMCLSTLHSVFREQRQNQRNYEQSAAARNGENKRFLGHTITIHNMQVVFIVGITVGSIFGGLIVFLVMLIGQACARQRKRINDEPQLRDATSKRCDLFKPIFFSNEIYSVQIIPNVNRLFGNRLILQPPRNN